VNVLAAVSMPVVDEPLVDLAPDQAPDAVQLVAPVLLQVNVVVPPLATEV
jgi:hypothetical protein